MFRLNRLVRSLISRRPMNDNSAALNSGVMPQAAKPATLEQLEERKLMASAYSYGINVNSLSSSTYANTVKMLRDTGTKSVRVWYGFKSYGERGEAGIMKYVRKLKSDGFDIMLAVVPSGGMTGTPAQVKGLFNHLVNIPGLARAVDRWQVGNEPDHDQYWRGSMSSYVTNFLAPASSVLRAKGEKVVSAGPSWNPADVKAQVNAGMLKYADFVGYHPYRSTLSDLKSRVAEVKRIVGGKPLIASEWNVRGREGNLSSWASGIKEFWPVIRDNFYAAYYYASIKSTTMAGKAGVITSSGSPNGAFYGTYKSLRTGYFATARVGADSSSPTAATPTVTKPATTTPLVHAFKIVDGTIGATIISKVNRSQTIALSSLPTRNIQIVAITNDETESVSIKFSGRGTRVENTPSYKAFAEQGGASTFNARAGTFGITAIAYGQDNATGQVGNAITLSLTFA